MYTYNVWCNMWRLFLPLSQCADISVLIFVRVGWVVKIIVTRMWDHGFDTQRKHSPPSLMPNPNSRAIHWSPHHCHIFSCLHGTTFLWLLFLPLSQRAQISALIYVRVGWVVKIIAHNIIHTYTHILSTRHDTRTTNMHTHMFDAWHMH
jgi:hypothetical protein